MSKESERAIRDHMQELASRLSADVRDVVNDGQNWDAASFVNRVLTPLSESQPAWHLAACADCQMPPMPFRDAAQRDAWADAHGNGTGHTISKWAENAAHERLP